MCYKVNVITSEGTHYAEFSPARPSLTLRLFKGCLYEGWELKPSTGGWESELMFEGKTYFEYANVRYEVTYSADTQTFTVRELMDLGTFLVQYRENAVKAGSDIQMFCAYCPLYKTCRADENADNRSCKDFLKTMVNGW